MATTDILLLKPVDGLGAEGEKVRVKAGYARNFLFPGKLALPVNRANLKQVEALQKARAEREAKELTFAQGLQEKITATNIAIAVKTGEGGKMFGSVTAADLVERLAAEGIEVERKQMNLYTPVKSLGKHTTQIKLHAELTAELVFEVVSENPIDEPVAEEEAAVVADS